MPASRSAVSPVEDLVLVQRAERATAAVERAHRLPRSSPRSCGEPLRLTPTQDRPQIRVVGPRCGCLPRNVPQAVPSRRPAGRCPNWPVPRPPEGAGRTTGPSHAAPRASPVHPELQPHALAFQPDLHVAYRPRALRSTIHGCPRQWCKIPYGSIVRCRSRRSVVSRTYVHHRIASTVGCPLDSSRRAASGEHHDRRGAFPRLALAPPPQCESRRYRGT
jgi:hypothetical protein